MKNLELENFGVQELDAREMKTIDGGLWAVFRIISGILQFDKWVSSHHTELKGEGLQDNTRVVH